jgi:hypothetical protein
VIATIPRGDALCIVRWTGRSGLKALAITYCKSEGNAGDGVEQVPDKVFTRDDQT